MGQFLLDNIAQLAMQMRFTPIPRRLEQLNAAEDLLLKLSPGKTYTIGEVTCAITGYEPRQPDATMLTGDALQHDLGLLLEEVSESLQLHVNSSPEPVLGIDDVAQRLSVTKKSVQRWRRRGLPARRYTFADGKRRIGFKLSSVQQFAGSPAGNQQVAAPPVKVLRDLAWLKENARRLAGLGYWDFLIGQRLTRACGIAPLSVVQILKEHVPEIQMPMAPDAQLRRAIVQAREEGQTLRQIAQSTGLPIFGVYRIILETRLTRVIRKKIRFYDDQLYHQNDVAAAIDAIATQDSVNIEQPAGESRVPRDLPPYLRSLYRTPLLTPSRERGLFLKYHYLRWLAFEKQKQFDPQISTYGQLKQFESLRRAARHVRAALVEANLRLVVSVARRHVRPSVSLMELVSEGNITLMRAVDSFDVHRGHRFSTYAVYALMRGFARYVPGVTSRQKQLIAPEFFSEICDASGERTMNISIAREEVRNLLQRLPARDRDVIENRYGIGRNDKPLTCRETGEAMNLSSQRIVQIEQQAMAKLRGMANPSQSM